MVNTIKNKWQFSQKEGLFNIKLLTEKKHKTFMCHKETGFL